MSSREIIEAFAEIAPRCQDEAFLITCYFHGVFSCAALNGAHASPEDYQISRKFPEALLEQVEMIASFGENYGASTRFERFQNVIED